MSGIQQLTELEQRMLQEGLDDDETFFRCPKCGSTYFTSDPNPDAEYRCSDQGEINCRWRGPASECIQPNPPYVLAKVIQRLLGG